MENQCAGYQNSGLGAAGFDAGPMIVPNYNEMRDQELRMRCLSMALAGMWIPDADVITRAQRLYDFALAKPKSGDEVKKAHGF